MKQLILVVILAVPATPHEISAGSVYQPLALHAVLDDNQYLPDQPVLLLIRVENRGARPANVPSLRHGDGFLRIILRRDGRILSPAVEYADEPPAKRNNARIALPAQRTQVEVINILEVFGEVRIRGHHPVASSFGQFHLPPGRYMLQIEMGPEEAGAATLQSSIQEFTVVPLDPLSKDAALLESVVEDCSFPDVPAYISPDALRIRRCCRQHLERSLKSKYLTLMYLAAGMPNESLPTNSLMSMLGSAGVPATKQAAILWWECKLSRLKGSAREAWLESTEGSWRRGINLEVLRAWRDRHVQKKFDPAQG